MHNLVIDFLSRSGAGFYALKGMNTPTALQNMIVDTIASALSYIDGCAESIEQAIGSSSYPELLKFPPTSRALTCPHSIQPMALREHRDQIDRILQLHIVHSKPWCLTRQQLIKLRNSLELYALQLTPQ
jgi:hypothetical protein